MGETDTSRLSQESEWSPDDSVRFYYFMSTAVNDTSFPPFLTVPVKVPGSEGASFRSKTPIVDTGNLSTKCSLLNS